jgi:hypothetical protein
MQHQSSVPAMTVMMDVEFVIDVAAGLKSKDQNKYQHL